MARPRAKFRLTRARTQPEVCDFRPAYIIQQIEVFKPCVEAFPVIKGITSAII
jgi:hypothetical protein